MTANATVHPKRGFIMMEVLIAVMMFATAGTALVVALNDIGNLSFQLHRTQRLARILDDELSRTLSLPNIEESTQTRSVVELGVDLETAITPIEEMENQDGQLLANMYRIRVSAYWYSEGETQTQSVETWRYARLYQR
jgi:Tfp pilus assembly protein PilV